MNREETEKALRELYVAHQDEWWMENFRPKSCTSCNDKMKKVMAIVDAYATHLAGDSVTKAVLG